MAFLPPAVKGPKLAARAWRYSRSTPKFSVNEKSFEAFVWLPEANRRLDEFEDERARLRGLLPEVKEPSRTS